MPDEAHLQALAARLKARGVAHLAIEEPDAPWNGALMAIGCVPARKEMIRPFVSSLPLLR